MKQIINLSCAILLIIIALKTNAQYTFFTPEGSFAVEVSLDNSNGTRLPIYRNAITSLTSTGDYVIGGTSSSVRESPFVFLCSISKKQLLGFEDLSSVIPSQLAIKTGFVADRKRQLFYGGSIAQSDSSGKLSGHLFTVKVGEKNEIIIKDLGTPLPGEGIFSLTGNSDVSVLYGISYPSGIFFSYNTTNGSTRTFERIRPSRAAVESLQDFDMTPDEFLPRLVMDNKGIVYGSMPLVKKEWSGVNFELWRETRLFSFNTANDSLNILPGKLPEVWGRGSLAQAQSWAVSKDGRIFGGNAGDGQLFLLDPVSGNVKNLGKPIMMFHIKGLTFGSNGNLYGIAGGKPGYSHLFYHNDKEGFVDYGNPQFNMEIPGIKEGIDWRGFQLGTITSSDDGKYIILGEDESLSQIMVFPVK